MKLVLTEKQIDTILKEFDNEPKQEKLSEKHYDEFVRLFHRLKELKDMGIIKDEEFGKIQMPMFDIMMRIKDDVPYFYYQSFERHKKED